MDADNRTDPDPGTEAGVVVAPVAAAWNEHPCPSAQPVEQAAWAGAFRHHDPARPATWGNRTRGNDGDWETAVNDLIFNRDLYQGGPASRRHEVGTVRGVAVSVQLHDDRSATISINHAYARTGNGNYPCVRITPGQRARINDVANLINAQAATARTTPGHTNDTYHRNDTQHRDTNHHER